METIDRDPFARSVRPVTDPAPEPMPRPATVLSAPAGGPVLVVSDGTLAREVMSDPRIVRDPAWAPSDWDPAVAGLQLPAAQQASLTTSDGPAHTELRRAHAPLFTARRLRAEEPAIAETARALLVAVAVADGATDLMADFTVRFPLTVLLDLLGIGRDGVDEAARACHALSGGDFSAIAALGAVADAGLRGEDNRATQLGERLGAGATRDDLRFHLFEMIFAGQLTTDVALGDLVLAELGPQRSGEPPEALVERVLNEHPPQPFTLWRFTTTDVEIAGERFGPRTPVLVDLRAVGRSGTPMAFGAGPHVCIGAQLARVELRAVVRVLRSDFPDARLAADVADLRREHLGGIGGARLTALPVRLRG